jgi:sugar/nucleoside kinase (ribokinase family)
MPVPGDIFDVLCYGTISVDIITRLPHLPQPRREVSATAEYTALGGEALSVAIALATWGLRVLLAGNVIGTDAKGQTIMDALCRYLTLDSRYVRQRANVNTPFQHFLVTPDGERSRITYWFEQSPQTVLTRHMMSKAALLSIDANGGLERDQAAAVARGLGLPVVSSDAIWPQFALSGLSDVIVTSRSWLQFNFPGVYEYDHALDLQARGAGVVIVTDGPRPVLVVRADGSAFGVEPYPVRNPTDTSDAGSFFKAGLIYGWNQPGWTLEQKVRFACAAGALSCQREGAASQPPTLAEVQALVAAG